MNPLLEFDTDESKPTAYMALTLGVRIGLFNALLEEESQAKSVATLASQLGIQEALLGERLQTAVL